MGLSPFISNGYHYVFFEKFNLIPNKVYIFLFYCTAVTTDKNFNCVDNNGEYYFLYPNMFCNLINFRNILLLTFEVHERWRAIGAKNT